MRFFANQTVRSAIGLAAAAWLTGTLAQADGLPPDTGLVLLNETMDASMEMKSRAVHPQEGSADLVTEKLINASGKPWSGIELTLDTWNAERSRFAFSDTTDTLSFGEDMPWPLWRNHLQLRLNDEYLGMEGGSWRATRSTNPDRIQIALMGMTVKPGDELTMRFLLTDKKWQVWRLHQRALPLGEACS